LPARTSCRPRHPGRRLAAAAGDPGGVVVLGLQQQLARPCNEFTCVLFKALMKYDLYYTIIFGSSGGRSSSCKYVMFPGHFPASPNPRAGPVGASASKRPAGQPQVARGCSSRLLVPGSPAHPTCTVTDLPDPSPKCRLPGRLKTDDVVLKLEVTGGSELGSQEAVSLAQLAGFIGS
jgi:hypothetical protein